jgi:arylformamidase
VHRTLLSQGIVIIELLDLSGVEEGDYNMIALPLRLKGADGAPCRVLLFEEGKVPSGD